MDGEWKHGSIVDRKRPQHDWSFTSAFHINLSSELVWIWLPLPISMKKLNYFVEASTSLGQTNLTKLFIEKGASVKTPTTVIFYILFLVFPQATQNILLLFNWTCRTDVLSFILVQRKETLQLQLFSSTMEQILTLAVRFPKQNFVFKNKWTSNIALI